MYAITHALRATVRLALIAFVTGLLLGTAATVAMAAPPADATPDLSAAHGSPAAPTTPGDLTICPEHADCDDDAPVDPTPQDGPGGFTTCPEGQDCSPDDDGPGGFTTCPEGQDCSPDEPTEEPSDDPDEPGDEPVDHDRPTVDGVPVPTRIETGMGGTAPSLWSLALLGDALLALAAGGAGAYLGTRL